MKAPKYVIAPEGCMPHLTPGKRYPVMNFDDTGYGIGFDTIDDDGVELYASLNDSAHLNGGDWIIPEDETDDSNDDPKTTKPRVTAVRVGEITVDCDENPNDICISDGPGDYIIVPRANIPALIEALKMMDSE